jgi:hypothetical protein
MNGMEEDTLVVIEESMKGKRKNLGMLLSLRPKRLIPYFYPLLPSCYM